MANRTWQAKGDALTAYAMKREEAYGNALSEKQCSARNDRINEVIANFVDGSGTLTYQEIASLITRLYPASKKIHPSRG